MAFEGITTELGNTSISEKNLNRMDRPRRKNGRRHNPQKNIPLSTEGKMMDRQGKGKLDRHEFVAGNDLKRVQRKRRRRRNSCRNGLLNSIKYG